MQDQQLQQSQQGQLEHQQSLLIWQNGSLIKNPSLAMVKASLQDPQSLVWLDQICDCAEVDPLLTDAFQLSPITVQVMCEERERAKFTETEKYFYIVVHALEFKRETEEADTPKLDIVFGKNFLLTSHRVSFPWLDELQKEIQSNTDDVHPMSRGVGYLLYDVLDTLVDTYFPVLDDIDDIIDDLEDVTINDTSNTVQIRIFNLKRMIAQMRRVISPQVEVANSLLSRTSKVIPVEAQPYFADIHDHIIRAFEVLDSYRDLMSGLLDVYLTTVSNRLNVIMKQLTIYASLFMPITFITGVFGQNFGFMPQVASDKGYNFWIILAVMTLLTGLQIWYFKRRGWL